MRGSVAESKRDMIASANRIRADYGLAPLPNGDKTNSASPPSVPTRKPIVRGGQPPFWWNKGKQGPSLLSAQAHNEHVMGPLNALKNPRGVCPSGQLIVEPTLSDSELTISVDLAQPFSTPQSQGGSQLSVMTIIGVSGDYWLAVDTNGAQWKVAKPFDLRNSLIYRSLNQYNSSGVISGMIPVFVTYSTPLTAMFTPQGNYTSNYDTVNYFVSPEIILGGSYPIVSVSTSSGNTTAQLTVNVPWQIGQYVTFQNVPGLNTPGYITGIAGATLTCVGAGNAGSYSGGGFAVATGATQITAARTGGHSGVVVGGSDVDWIDLNLDCRGWTVLPLVPNP